MSGTSNGTVLGGNTSMPSCDVHVNMNMNGMTESDLTFCLHTHAHIVAKTGFPFEVNGTFITDAETAYASLKDDAYLDPDDSGTAVFSSRSLTINDTEYTAILNVGDLDANNKAKGLLLQETNLYNNNIELDSGDGGISLKSGFSAGFVMYSYTPSTQVYSDVFDMNVLPVGVKVEEDTLLFVNGTDSVNNSEFLRLNGDGGRIFKFNVMAQKLIGCGINTNEILASVGQTLEYTFEYHDGKTGKWVNGNSDLIYIASWEKVTSSLTCLNTYEFTVEIINPTSQDIFICDMLACVKISDVQINPCKVTNKCENFCVKVYNSTPDVEVPS